MWIKLSQHERSRKKFYLRHTMTLIKPLQRDLVIFNVESTLIEQL